MDAETCLENRPPSQRTRDQTDTRRIACIAVGETRTGGIVLSGGISIAGAVRGDIVSSETVYVSGLVQGKITATDVVIEENGVVIGDIEAMRTVTVGKHGMVFGNITCANISNDGFVKGNISLKKELDICCFSNVSNQIPENPVTSEIRA